MTINREHQSRNAARTERGSLDSMLHSTRPTFLAYGRQAARLQERREKKSVQVCIRGVRFDIFRGVYDTGVDTELMIDSVSIQRHERFLEVGCGAGAISIFLAGRAKGGVGVDISSAAIDNSRHNSNLLGIPNVSFFQSDVFHTVHEQFDVLVCNPPYSCFPAADEVDMMFWDPANRMKRRFFSGAAEHLNPCGRIYFGWADFRDVVKNLPVSLATMHGFPLRNIHERFSHSGSHRFLVLEFHKNPAH